MLFLSLGEDKHLKDTTVAKFSSIANKNLHRLITDFFDRKSENPGILFLSLQADNEGCFTQFVKTKIFQLRQKLYDMTIQVEAKVREEGTGLCFLKYVLIH